MKYKKIKIVFMGTSEFGIPTLKLLNQEFNLKAVITNVDKRSGRGLNFKESEVKIFAKKNKIHFLQPDNLKDPNFIEQICCLKPDFIIVIAFRMIPRIVWEIPRYGTINLHASLLPNYRGAAPINWVIINNENKTGLTTFFIDENIDTGKILLQNHISIDEKINAGELHEKLKLLGPNLVFETIIGVYNDKIIPLNQDKDDNIKKAPKFDKKNTIIQWNKSVIQVYNKIRGLNPYPGARTTISNNLYSKRVIIYDSEYVIQNHDYKVGKFIINNSKIKVYCSDGFIIIKSLKLEGKRKMDCQSFLNGFDIENYNMFK